jgi:hypothetical protein
MCLLALSEVAPARRILGSISVLSNVSDDGRARSITSANDTEVRLLSWFVWRVSEGQQSELELAKGTKPV